MGPTAYILSTMPINGISEVFYLGIFLDSFINHDGYETFLENTGSKMRITPRWDTSSSQNTMHTCLYTLGQFITVSQSNYWYILGERIKPENPEKTHVVHQVHTVYPSNSQQKLTKHDLCV